MTVIFLDVDGVLNPNRPCSSIGSHEDRWVWPELAVLLRELVEQTSAKVQNPDHAENYSLATPANYQNKPEA